MTSKRVLDKLDKRILDLLQQNARHTNTEIGKQVGLSQPAVTARIQRMEEEGVIEGYGARVNPRRAGLEISALIRLKTTHDKIDPCLRLFGAMPEIVASDRITGEDCFVVRATVATMSQLEAVIDRLAVFGAVSTSIVLASYPGKGFTMSAS
jgi:Lrp/AsnC family leucine-responsive transcriptional regulator